MEVLVESISLCSEVTNLLYGHSFFFLGGGGGGGGGSSRNNNFCCLHACMPKETISSQ